MRTTALPWLLLLALAAGSCGRTGVGDDARVEPELPTPRLSYTLRQGEALFLHYCATCHGEGGRGDGFNAYNLDPKPRDLTAAALQSERSDEELAALIRTGGGAVGLSNAMPPWGRTLDDRQIGQLVSYLRSLRREGEE